MADAVAEEYKSSLADLNFNSKPHINMLTMLAEDNIKYAPQIVQTIVDHIQTVSSEVKLPGLYLVDSIIKNVGKQYLPLFSQNLVTVFSCVFEKVEENTRSLLYKLRQTWNDILPNKILYAVDVRIKKLDPAWPVTAQAPAQSIHINPKFLGSNKQSSADISVVKKEEDRIKAQQGEVLKQLLAKQEQLRLLEQKKKEITNRHRLLERTAVQSAPQPSLPPAVDPRAIAKANPKLSHRDPRLQKINPVPALKLVQNTTTVKNSKSPHDAVNIPQVAVSGVKKTSEPSPESQPLITNSEKNNALLNEPIKNVPSPSKSVASSPKKASSKKAEEHLQAVKNSPSDKSKNHSSKNHDYPNKGKDEDKCVIKESADSKVQEHNPDAPKEIEKPKPPKELEKSPRTAKKKSSSPEEKNKMPSRYSRNQNKSEASKKLPFRQRSRSPIHKSKSKSDGRRFGAIEKGTETSEANNKSAETSARDQGGRGRGKRETSMSKDEDSKENESAPPEKKLREDVPDDHSDRSEDSHLFGKEDQDYRQISKSHNETTNPKGWAQYKASHPDEYKSPLRPARENDNLKIGPIQNLGSNEGFFPPEYDKLGRRRLHRGRQEQRFHGRRGFFMRGPGNRFDAPFPPMEQPFKDPLASMMLTDPNIILQQAEAKFRLGRISENEYMELRRDLEIMLQSEEYCRLRDQTFKMQCPERFRMSAPQGLVQKQIPVEKRDPRPFFKGEAIKIQGPRLPVPEVRQFKLDNKMRTIHFVDDKALVIMDNDEPRELKFKGDSREVFIEGLTEPILLGFDGKSTEFEIDGKRHIMRFGAPSREIYINNHPYEAKFGGPPFAAMLEDGRLYRIRLGGTPPQVVVGDKPQFELFSKFRGQGTGPPFQPLKVEHNLDPPRRAAQPSGGSVPFDVDMRMNVDESVRKPPENFGSPRDDMKDVDWRHIPPAKPNDESKFFEPIGMRPEPWDQNVHPPINQNFHDRNAQSQQEWKNDRPPLISHEWEALPPPPFPKLNPNPRNTPPNDKEWDRQHQFETMERQDWRDKEFRHDSSAPPPNHQHPNQMNQYDQQRNSSLHIKEEPPQYRGGPTDVIRPNMPHPIRPPFDAPAPQQGPWQRPNIGERGPAPHVNNYNLLPPPLPPFNLRPPMVSNEPRAPLLPLPSIPPLLPMTETLHEKVLRATTVPVTKDSSGALSSGVSNSEDSSGPTAVPAVTSPLIDVGTLFQKLIAAGIINSKGVNESNEENETKLDKEKKSKKEKDSILDDEPIIPPIPLTREGLRRHYPGVISALYRGSQCASCGMRFKEIQSDHYSRHLDWHFRMNRREKDGVKKAFSRRWYYEVEDWNQFEEFEDFEERAPSYFELQADGTQMQTEEPVDVPSVPASGQETEVCVVCDEPFQLFWVEEEEEWHLRDAVRHEEQAYHPACYEDHKKASEIPEAPAEDATALIKQEPSEKTAEETAMEVTELLEEVSIKKEEDSEPMNVDETEPVMDAATTNSEVEGSDRPETEVKIKEEPPEDILEGKPGEEEIIGLISETEAETTESEEPKVEPKMVVQSGGGIVLKIKAESMQPQSPAAPTASAEKDAANEAAQESEEEEFRPPTPDPRFQVLPPVNKGTELSGLCCIM